MSHRQHKPPDWVPPPTAPPPKPGDAGQRQELAAAVAAVRQEFAQVTAERDRARSLAARLEQICSERSRLLWLAIEPQPSYVAQAAVGRSIARHLRETEFIAGVTDA